MQLLGLNITRAAQGNVPERRSTLAAPTQFLLDAIRSVMGGEGTSVNEQTALSLAAVQACVRVIAESVATMPLRFYRDDFGNKTTDNAHPLSYLINEPNPMQSRFDFISWTVSQLKMGGNAYLRIHRDPLSQRPVMLEPISHKRVEPKQSPGLNVFYKVEGIEEPVPATDMLHFKGLTNGNPMKGINPIQVHAQSLGVTIGAQTASAKFYSKNAALKWAIKWNGQNIGEEQAKKLKQSFENVQAGGEGSLVIPNGAELQQLNLTPQEAEFLMTRRYGVEDIARIFGVPAYMIGADTQGIKSSVEQQAQDFYVQTILPIVTMMEQELRRKLLREDEKGTYYFKFIFNSLLRADAKSRAEFYNMGIRGGWLSPNEARGLEDFNNQAGGDTTFTESNLVPSDMMRPWIQSKIYAAPQAEAHNNNEDGNN